MKLTFTFLTVLTCTGLAMAGDWPQGAGPNGNLAIANEMPVEWSVALDENIHWKITLPETGQNTPTVFGDKVFLSTYKPWTKRPSSPSAISALLESPTSAVPCPLPMEKSSPTRFRS